MENLSKFAQEKINKMKMAIQEVVEQDKQREPKLTAEEKATIAKSEALIEKNRPVKEKLLNLIRTKDARLKFLERNGQQLIIEGGDVDAIVTEWELLKPALLLLEETHRAASMESAVAESNIRHIKEAARVRELREEAHDGQ